MIISIINIQRKRNTCHCTNFMLVSIMMSILEKQIWKLYIYQTWSK